MIAAEGLPMPDDELIIEDELDFEDIMGMDDAAVEDILLQEDSIESLNEFLNQFFTLYDTHFQHEPGQGVVEVEAVVSEPDKNEVSQTINGHLTNTGVPEGVSEEANENELNELKVLEKPLFEEVSQIGDEMISKVVSDTFSIEQTETEYEVVSEGVVSKSTNEKVSETADDAVLETAITRLGNSNTDFK